MSSFSAFFLMEYFFIISFCLFSWFISYTFLFHSFCFASLTYHNLPSNSRNHCLIRTLKIHSWPLNNTGVRSVDPLHSQKYMCNLTVVPPCLHFHTHGSSNWRSCSAVVHIPGEKNPHLSVPAQFKLGLFKSQQ